MEHRSSLNELLQCIQHLLSWVPLDDVVTDNLMLQLFDLATYREVFDCSFGLNGE